MATTWRLFQQRVRFHVRCFSVQTPPTSPLSKLLPYQRQGVERLVQSKRLLLADEMGLGKTAQCVAAIGVLRKERMPENMRVLIALPKRLIPVWTAELDKWLEFPFTLQIADPRSFPLPSIGLSITLINYELCDRFRDELHKQVYDVVICDEAHYLKSQKAKRTRAVLGSHRSTGMEPTWLWLLTGTPVLNRPAELYPLLRALDPGQFSNFRAFLRKFCDGKVNQYGDKSLLDSRGVSNLDELAEKLQALMLRRLKKHVLDQLPLALPPKYHSCVCLTVSDANIAEHEGERFRSMVAKMDRRERHAVDLKSFGSGVYGDLMRYLEEITGLDMSDIVNRRRILGILATVRKETALAKVDPAIEFLQDMISSSQKKVVVFAHHRKVISSLMERLGDQAVCVMGGTSDEEQSLALRRFNEDPEVRIFVGSISATGVGLNLTAASDVVFLELDWSPAKMSQAEDRCHRLGQLDESVRIHYLVFPGTFDERIAKALFKKQATIDQILPEKNPIVEPVYIFDFGMYKGKGLLDVPRNYIGRLLDAGAWRHRLAFWRALFRHGVLSEVPPFSPSDSNEKMQFVFNFGKHAGKEWSDVPYSYRKWVIEEGKKGTWDSRADLKAFLIEEGHIRRDPVNDRADLEAFPIDPVMQQPDAQ